MSSMQAIADNALKAHLGEIEDLRFLPESRYDRSWWPTLGQYDWFCGQLLYCLVRAVKPKRMVEISTSSGYSTVYSALALKRNGGGVIHTFELDTEVAAGASRTFERLGLNAWIDLNVGDAKINVPKKPELKDAELFFLDSLHTSEFMLWFMDVLLKGSREDALFHVHDIMPRNARVRYRGNPGRGVLNDLTKWAYNRWKGGLPPAELVWPTVRRPEASGELAHYNGIETMEAVLANELASRMDAGDYLFAHDFSKLHPEAEPQRYAARSVGRSDSFGKPSEWNDAWWTHSGPALKALERWIHDGKPVRV